MDQDPQNQLQQNLIVIILLAIFFTIIIMTWQMQRNNRRGSVKGDQIEVVADEANSKKVADFFTKTVQTGGELLSKDYFDQLKELISSINHPVSTVNHITQQTKSDQDNLDQSLNDSDEQEIDEQTEPAQIIKNGDFSLGFKDWEASGDLSLLNQVKFNDQTYEQVANIGANNTNLLANQLQQQIKLPNLEAQKSLLFSFVYNLKSAEDALGFDEPGVMVYFGDQQLFQADAAQANQGWKEFKVVLNQFAGQANELTFLAGNTGDELKPTWVELDEVKLEVVDSKSEWLLVENIAQVNNLDIYSDTDQLATINWDFSNDLDIEWYQQVCGYQYISKNPDQQLQLLSTDFLPGFGYRFPVMKRDQLNLVFSSSPIIVTDIDLELKYCGGKTTLYEF